MKVHDREHLVITASIDIENEISKLEYHYEELALALVAEPLVTPHVDPTDEDYDPARVESIRRIFQTGCEKHDLTFGEQIAVVGKLLRVHANSLVRIERGQN